MEREFEIVIFGATGFTGRLTASHLIQQHVHDQKYPVRLAFAGRNIAKLTAVRAELAERWSEAKDIPILEADAFDTKALLALAARTKVIVTTVGPYAKYGMNLVEACAKSGTHYVDLTGEVTFMRRTIDAFDAVAKESGARIVHCCGYDSIPSDLGTWLAIRTYKERFATLPDRVVHAAGESRGGVSGGTIASMLELFEEMSQKPQLRRLLSNPYALVDGARGQDRGDQIGVRFDNDLQLWTAPFVMAPVNSKVVRRSLALQAAAGSEGVANISYQECMSTGRGARGLVQSALVTGLLGGGVTAMSWGPMRRFAQRWMFPKPGEGPGQTTRDQGYFVSRLVATGSEGAVHVMIRGQGDPGYAATSRMLGESAICLARDQIEGPSGIRTPASTMPEALLKRLQQQGISFEVQ